MTTSPSDQLPIGHELSAEQRRVQQVVYDLWNPALVWPHSNSVDRILDRQHGIDIAKVLPMIPDRYISFHRAMPTDTEIRLTIAGIACCEGSNGDIALFFRALQWCVEKERTFEPPASNSKEELRLTTEDARGDWTGQGGEATPRILTKAFSLITLEYVGYGGPTGRPDEWALSLNRNVRNYRGVHTLTGYLAIKDKLREPAASPVIYSGPRMTGRPFAGFPLPLGSALDGLGTPLTPSEMSAAADELTLTLQDIHPVVATACRDLFDLGRFREGVLAAVLAFRDQVRLCTGLTHLDGAELMGKAFGGPQPMLDAAGPALDPETRKNIRQGTVYLSQGLIFLVRNPLTHNSTEIQPASGMRMVGLVDLLYRLVDDRPAASHPLSAPVPAKTSESTNAPG